MKIWSLPYRMNKAAAKKGAPGTTYTSKENARMIMIRERFYIQKRTYLPIRHTYRYKFFEICRELSRNLDNFYENYTNCI